MSAGNDDQVQDDDEDDCMTSIEPVVQSPSFTRSKAILVVWAILCLFCYLLVLQVIHSIGRYHSLISEPEKEFCHSEANDNSTVTTSSDRSVQSQTSSLMKKLSNLIFQATTSFAVYDLSTNGSSKRKSEAAAAVVIASASMDSVRLTRDTNQHTEKVIMFPLAHTTSPNLSPDQISLLRQFSYRVIKYIPDLPARASLIPWGGGSLAPWWTPTMKTNPNNEDVDHVPGGRLLWYYYKILRHYMSDISNLDHGVHFPLGLCRHQGCPAEISIAHTLQWRELYQPFRFTPAMVQENRNGFCYTRGFSLVSSDKTLNGHHPYGRHAMVWMRLGRHKVIDGLTYYRVVLHSIDKAVGAALQASDQRVGKFNVLFDGTDFELRKVPEMKYVKHVISILQDHYPNRLGVIVVTNVSRTAEFVVNLIKPLISKEVRNKIHFLSHEHGLRASELEALIEKEYIPDWLGGLDNHQFDVEEYYSDKHHVWSVEEGRAFVRSMPYHAVS